jgi:RHS repeat-associated protein
MNLTASRAAAALLAGVLGATLLPSLPASAHGPAQPVPAPPVAGPGLATHFDPPEDPTHAFRATATTWPTATSARVTLPAPAAGTGRATMSTVSGLPVSAGAVAERDGSYRGPKQLDVRVLDHAAAGAAGVDGVLFSVTPHDPGSGTVHIGLDYGAFAQAYGGNYGARLHLVRLPACALTTPSAAGCRTATPLASTNATNAHTVSADLAVSSAATVLAATAGAGTEGGASGSYAATTLKPSGTWASGSGSGAFTYSYPITVPAAGSALVPQLALSYDSGRVDGQTSQTATQSSWVGDGWNTPDSFIEQTFTSCADKPEGTASPVITGDECYAGPVLTLSVDGASTALVWDKGKSVWKPSRDDGSVITHATGTDNGTGTYNTDSWTLTKRNGTVYRFGLNHLPGWASGRAATNSVDSVPVYSAHSGDPCYQAAGFTSSACVMAYRWHLDYVKDTHGNAMAYYYKQSTNFYGQDNGAKNTSYVRDSYLDHIDYGFTDGNAYGTVPDQVQFIAGDRCLSGTCQPLNASTKANWPDVPFDLVCASGATCTSASPSFFSTVRLASIVTKQFSTISASSPPVDSYTLTQTLPAPADVTSPALWLSSIVRTAADTRSGAGASITLPAVTFTPTQSMPNRVDTTNFPALDRFRLQAVTTEAGSVITASYTRPVPCSAPVTVNPLANVSSCYPVYWLPTGYANPVLDWFNKYAVSKVTVSDPTGGAPATTTSYQYPGGGAWHWDDNEVVQAKYRSHGQFRGYGDVKTFTGDAVNDPRAESETTYYRGMSKDNNTTVVNVTDSQGGVHEDLDQLAGAPLETTAYLGENGSVDHSTITSYWVSGATATRPRSPDLPDLTANWVEPLETYTRQALTATGSTTWRVTETDNAYDTSVTDPNVGVPTFTYSHTVPAVAAYDRCGYTTYAAGNAGANLVGLPSQKRSFSAACAGFTQGSPASVPSGATTLALPSPLDVTTQTISDTETFYDDPTFSTTYPQAGAPSHGDVTMTRVVSGYNPTTTQTTARHTYDAYGEVTAAWDAVGNKSTTDYTRDAVGLVTGTHDTNALNQGTTTTLDPVRNLPMTVTDPNAVVTTRNYDALGRVTALWENSRATSQSANTTYAYQLVNNGLAAETTGELDEGGVYLPTVTIYDAQLRVRQVQATPAQGTGRVVTDTFYDSRGWTRQTNNKWYDPSTAPSPATVTTPGTGVHIYDNDVYTLDGLGRVVADAKRSDTTTMSTTTTVHNGDRTTVVPPAGQATTTTVTDPLGRTSELDTYTAAPTLHTPANTFTGLFTVSGGTTTATLYGFDSRGNQNSVTDAGASTRTTVFNLLGQATSVTDPDTGETTMVNDANGNLLQSTDHRGKVVSYVYDALNRKTAEYFAPSAAQSPANQRASWVYDNATDVAGVTHAVGQLTAETSYQGGQAYTVQKTDFNVFGESLGETVSLPASAGNLAATPYVFSHTYTTNLGLPQKDSYPASGGLPAETVLHGYTVNDRPSSLNGASPYASSTTYDAWGRATSETFGTTTGSAFSTLDSTYDPHTGLLTDQQVRRQGSVATVLDDQRYARDPSGNITQQTESRPTGGTAAETQCFHYDALVRLDAAWTATDGCAATPTSTAHAMVTDPLSPTGAYWTTWTFKVTDPGERNTQTQHSLTGGADTTTTDAYDGNGASQPHTITGTTTAGGSTGSTSYHYDGAGHMTSRVADQGNQTLAWDDAGKLTSVTSAAGATSYVYDADNNVLMQSDPGSTTLYLPGEQLTLNAVSLTVSGLRYLPLPGGGTAVRTGTGSSFTFEFTDPHGTPTAYLDHTAQTAVWRQYTPYGAARGPAVAAPDNHGFLNQVTDVATGLVQVGARPYDTSLGAFISRDPIFQPQDPQQINGYSYAANNPVSNSDPSGATRKDLEDENSPINRRDNACDAKCIDTENSMTKYCDWISCPDLNSWLQPCYSLLCGGGWTKPWVPKKAQSPAPANPTPPAPKKTTAPANPTPKKDPPSQKRSFFGISTFGQCISGSLQAFLTVSGSLCVAIDGNHFGFMESGEIDPFGLGAGASVSPSYFVSNGNLDDQRGGSDNLSVSGHAGLVGITAPASYSSDSNVWSAGIGPSFGPSVGVAVPAGASKTAVQEWKCSACAPVFSFIVSGGWALLL